MRSIRRPLFRNQGRQWRELPKEGRTERSGGMRGEINDARLGRDD